MDIICSRYAESLFALAKEENQIDVYQKDMNKIHDVFSDENFVQFFSHVALQDDIKMNVLKKCFENQVSLYVFNFLMLLVTKRRIKFIQGICEHFQSLCNDYFGIKVGKVYSAYSLSDEEIMRIENVMSQKENKKVQLRMIIDETLIGGIKVEIDNRVYDDSLSYKLETLKKELLESR
ncbi:MAG: F0F1 ATP synthase subunit delta [Coprobacillus sp.]